MNSGSKHIRVASLSTSQGTKKDLSSVCAFMRRVHNLERRQIKSQVGLLSSSWRRRIARVRSRPAKDLVRLCFLEWQLLALGAIQERDVWWPTTDAMRSHVLTLCFNASSVPPLDAWRSLIGKPTAINDEYSMCWHSAWHEFTELARNGALNALACESRGLDLLSKPFRNRGYRGFVVKWQDDAVRSFFRLAWQRVRRSGREPISRLEESWWQRVRSVFPQLRAVRHIILPGTRMHLDIYWPAHRVALEIQGEPHWRSVSAFGGAEAFAKRAQRDATKRALCREMNVKLLEVSAKSDIRKMLIILRTVLRTGRQR